MTKKVELFVSLGDYSSDENIIQCNIQLYNKEIKIKSCAQNS